MRVQYTLYKSVSDLPEDTVRTVKGNFLKSKSAHNLITKEFLQLSTKVRLSDDFCYDVYSDVMTDQVNNYC